jgi:replicative DNA helicase
MLGGDVGSGKSALALGIALRAAMEGRQVAFLSGEMDEDRLLERALAIEARIRIDDIRSGNLTDETRSMLGAAAVRIRDLPLRFLPLSGQTFDDALAASWEQNPDMIIIDYLQLLPSPVSGTSHEEGCAASVRALKAMCLGCKTACFTVAQLPRHSASRGDRRPTLDDFGALDSVKQHGDVVLGLYREDMYTGGIDVQGATELIVIKNRNGPTGFTDLYFYRQWMRFEDMLDPDR